MLSAEDLEELRRAKRLLENPNWVVRLSAVAGRPVEWMAKLLPRADGVLSRGARASLEAALWAARLTLAARSRATPRDRTHRAVATAAGVVGGVFGAPGAFVELPATTVLMLRAIAEHARAQGEDLAAPETQRNCLAVFALGGTRTSDDAAESGYFAVRLALATKLPEHLGRLAATAAYRRFIQRVAARFGPAAAQKLTAQAVPLIGAATGAAINLAFMQHFQEVAWAHFTVRRLERTHGPEPVRAAYEALD